jgi:hypothetical protein
MWDLDMLTDQINQNSKDLLASMQRIEALLQRLADNPPPPDPSALDNLAEWEK